VNILYPFVETEEESVVESLRDVLRGCEPFEVTLRSTGCFGGKNRGVLWLYPDSVGEDGEECNKEPLVAMQRDLERAFPMCYEQRKQGGYSPHMTLGHFASLGEAQEAEMVVKEQWKPISFQLQEIYLLRRVGDDGQFLVRSVIPLGEGTDREAIIFSPPKPFEFMPSLEEDWVREERMKLKERRNRGSRHSRPRRKINYKTQEIMDATGHSTSRDSPEVIAAKRAARKEKRERKEREAFSNREEIPES